MDNSSAPAYPVLAFDTHNNESYVPGLTKREYFAGLAMQSLIARKDELHPFNMVANKAVYAADALLAELSKPQP